MIAHSAVCASIPSLDPQVFRDIFAGFPSGVTIVTTRDKVHAPIGLTVSAVMSISLTPPLLAVCLQNHTYTLQEIRRSGGFAVNFLAADQDGLSSAFAFGNGDKFAKVEWHEGASLQMPLLAGARAQVECRNDQIIEAGDHTLIIGAIVAGQCETTAPLTYCARQYADLAYRPRD